jgi:hypothetical protein
MGAMDEEGAEVGVNVQAFKTLADVADRPAIKRITVGNLRVCFAGTAATPANRTIYEPWIRDAVRKWTDAIRPAANTSVYGDVVFTCAAGGYDTLVGLYTGPGRAFALTNGMVLYEASGDERTVLHEFGHIFGAGDTYLENAPACMDDHPDSVMCAKRIIYMNPQTDDILAVQEAFCYADPAKCNRRWSSSANWCGAAGHELHLGDFNRDGRQDMLCHRQSDGYKWIAFANSAGKHTGTSWEYPLNWCHSPARLFIGDFNGDDRDDLLCHRHSDGYKWIAYANEAGTFTGTNWDSNLNWCKHQGGALYIGDFNGDNRDDLLCHDVYNGWKWIAHATQSGTFTGTTWEANLNWCAIPGVLHIGKFNQDSRDDLLCHHMDNGYKWIAQATQWGTFTGTTWHAPLYWCGGVNGSIHVGDTNADGREDMICHDRNQGTKWISLAKANGSFAGTTRYSIPDEPLRCHADGRRFLVGDFNGDRAADFMCHDQYNGSKNVFFQSPLQ